MSIKARNEVNSLYLLLFDHSFRTRFLDGTLDSSEISENLLAQFSLLDVTEMKSMVQKIQKTIMHGELIHGGGVLTRFRLTLGDLEKLQLQKLTFDFLASNEFLLTADIKLEKTECVSIEEAFYIFLKNKPNENLFLNPDFLEYEAYMAVVGIFVHNPEPLFSIKRLNIIRRKNVTYGLTLCSKTFLEAMYPKKDLTNYPLSAWVVFAATQRGLLHGPIFDPENVESYFS